METPTAIPAIPRLRVSRQHQSTVYDYSGSVDLSEAGPSRFQIPTNPLEPSSHQDAENTDDGEEGQDTPKLLTISALPMEPSSAFPEDTPAARLKAVLERTSTRTRPPPAPIPSLGSATDFDSDFDIPTIGSSQPSLARETLNSLFTHALREPGDTPQKSVKGKMRRRNSIDTSEVESGPRVGKAKKDRTNNKGKRRSMSDDELSAPNIFIDRSQAAVFDTLRQRLDHSPREQKKTQVSPQSNTGIDLDESLDTVKFLKELDTSHFAPPAATSTPRHSWTNSQFQSNLLDQDSDMQRAMRDLDSYEHTPPLVDVPQFPMVALNEPSNAAEQSNHSQSSSHSERQKARSNLAHENPRLDHAKSRSRDAHQHEGEWSRNYPKVNAMSTDTIHRHSLRIPSGISSSYRPLSRNGSVTSNHVDDTVSLSSATSHNNYYLLAVKEKESEQDAESEYIQNKPHVRSAVRPLSMPNASLLSPPEPVRVPNFPNRPGSRLSTLSPRPSFHSHHSRSSSRASSSGGSLFSSTSDVGADKVGVDHERERNWNAPRPIWHQHPSSSDSRPSTTVGIHSLTAERVRSLSFPDRPESRLSTSSPRPSRQRQASHDSSQSSSHASSRAGSPLGSLRSFGSMDTADKEVLHEQERNWNSPRPHWGSHSRSNSSGHNPSSSSKTLKRTPSLTEHSSHTPFSSAPAAPSVHFSMDTSSSARRRAESMKSTRAPLIHSSSPVRQQDFPRPGSSLSSFTALSMKRSALPSSHPSRPNSPLPSPHNKDGPGHSDSTHASLLPSLSVQSKSQNTPHNTPSPAPVGSFSPKLASTSPSVSQRNPSTRSSHIPVRASSKMNTVGTVLFPDAKTESPAVQEVQEVKYSIPSVHLELTEDDKDEIMNSNYTATDNEVQESRQPVQERTPTLRPKETLPPTEFPGHSEVSSVHPSNESKERLQKITSPPSPPLSPPSDGPSTPEANISHSAFSFPSTPPQKDSYKSTKSEFQTPSPPKNLPDLPGPPSSVSSDNEDNGLHALIQENISNLKTPKPPGAWTATPLPPGMRTLLHSNSLPTDDENDSGLATPAASLSRAATMPLRTPALPGGWLNTPASRKTVRFREDSLSQAAELSSAEVMLKSEERTVDTAANSSEQSHSPKLKADITSNNKVQVSLSRTTSSRKATTIRVVDEFGHEEKKKGSFKNHTIRIVDALGRVKKDSLESNSSIIEGTHPPTHKEALDRVRNGLHELAEELKDEEGLRHISTSEKSRVQIRALEKTSQVARESRVRLTSEMFSNAENIKKKLTPLRASMQQSTPFVPSPSHRRSSGRYWFLWGFIQILIVYTMYRAATSYAKKMFFTTYYDPLYPDLFFYASSPTNYCSSPSAFDILRREGFRAAARQVLAYLVIFLSSWQLPCQLRYQESSAIWPPT